MRCVEGLLKRSRLFGIVKDGITCQDGVFQAPLDHRISMFPSFVWTLVDSDNIRPFRPFPPYLLNAEQSTSSFLLPLHADGQGPKFRKTTHPTFGLMFDYAALPFGCEMSISDVSMNCIPSLAQLRASASTASWTKGCRWSIKSVINTQRATLQYIG